MSKFSSIHLRGTVPPPPPPSSLSPMVMIRSHFLNITDVIIILPVLTREKQIESWRKRTNMGTYGSKRFSTRRDLKINPTQRSHDPKQVTFHGHDVYTQKSQACCLLHVISMYSIFFFTKARDMLIFANRCDLDLQTPHQ